MQPIDIQGTSSSFRKPLPRRGRRMNGISLRQADVKSRSVFQDNTSMRLCDGNFATLCSTGQSESSSSIPLRRALCLAAGAAPSSASFSCCLFIFSSSRLRFVAAASAVGMTGTHRATADHGCQFCQAALSFFFSSAARSFSSLFSSCSCACSCDRTEMQKFTKQERRTTQHSCQHGAGPFAVRASLIHNQSGSRVSTLQSYPDCAHESHAKTCTPWHRLPE